MLKRILTLALLFVPSVAFGQTYWGDYQDSNQTEYMYFPTSDDTGAKVTLGSGALACYENGSATQFTSGLTLDNDFDSVTGLHQIAVDFSDANFEAGKTYTIILTAGTADGVDLTGSPVVTFSIGRYAIAPDGFDGLDIDGAGAVIIQDGTDPGQIDTNGGAVVSVTTTGTVTNGVNVTQFGGTNGTFASGIPAVNSTHWGGTAVASANVRADVRQILGTTLTDVGSGNFGSTLAGNFSILFGQSTNESNTAIGASEINNILTRTNRIPNIAAGSSGGLLIAGSNAPTTFSTLTSTGAMSINGVSNVAQTGDSFARLGAPAGASVSADIAGIEAGSGLDAAGVRAAIGMASANLDVQLAAKPDTDEVLTEAELTAALGPVDADVVDDSRTWFATDYRARNIVTVGENFVGTLALQPDLNPGSTLAGVTSVSITGAATVTATDLEVNRAKTRAHFTVPALATTGTYTVVVTVTTVDGQTIPTTATLKVQ